MTGEPNLLVMPNIDAANISFNLLKMVAGSGITIGPILLGSAAPVQIVTPTASSRRLINRQPYQWLMLAVTSQN